MNIFFCFFVNSKEIKEVNKEDSLRENEMGLINKNTEMDRKATQILEASGLLSRPIDIVKLAHEKYDFLILETLLPRKITGMLAVSSDGPVLGTSHKKVIVVSSALSSIRQRFVIAHELAHFISNNEGQSGSLYFRDYDNAQTPEEQEADLLARCLLMPSKLIKEVGITDKDSVSLIAEKFWVSEQRAEERIHDME